MSQVPHPSSRPERFRLTEADIWPGCLEIGIEGDLDLAVSGRLDAALATAASAGHHVLVDLEACDFIDASALGVLVRADQALKDRGCQLLLYGVRGQVRRMLSVTGVAEDGLAVADAKTEIPSLARPAAPRRELRTPTVVPLGFAPSPVGYAAG